MAGRADSKLHRRRVPPVMCVHIPHGGRKESVMRYNTKFDGEFALSKRLDAEEEHGEAVEIAVAFATGRFGDREIRR
jgi:hypothetical protein